MKNKITLKKCISYFYTHTSKFFLKTFYLLIPSLILKNNSQKIIRINIDGSYFQCFKIDRLEKENFKNLLENFKIITSITKCNFETAIDIGANFGFYSYALSKVGFRKIISLEPNPIVYDLMVENFKRNNLINVISLPYGIYSKTKELALSYPSHADKIIEKKGDKYSSGSYSLKGEGKESVIGKFKKFIDAKELNKINKCNLIKIDVEGVEVEVLKEIEPLLQNYKPTIILELNNNFLNREDFNIIKKIMINNGYENFQMFHETKSEIISNDFDSFINKICSANHYAKDVVFF